MIPLQVAIPRSGAVVRSSRLEGLLDVVDGEATRCVLVRSGGFPLGRVGVDVLEELEATVAVRRLEHRGFYVVAIEADAVSVPIPLTESRPTTVNRRSVKKRTSLRDRRRRHRVSSLWASPAGHPIRTASSGRELREHPVRIRRRLWSAGGRVGRLAAHRRICSDSVRASGSQREERRSLPLVCDNRLVDHRSLRQFYASSIPSVTSRTPQRST